MNTGPLGVPWGIISAAEQKSKIFAEETIWSRSVGLSTKLRTAVASRDGIYSVRNPTPEAPPPPAWRAGGGKGGGWVKKKQQIMRKTSRIKISYSPRSTQSLASHHRAAANGGGFSREAPQTHPFFFQMRDPIHRTLSLSHTGPFPPGPTHLRSTSEPEDKE